MIEILLDISSPIEIGIGSRHYRAAAGSILVEDGDVASAKDHLRVVGWLHDDEPVTVDEQPSASEEIISGTE